MPGVSRCEIGIFFVIWALDKSDFFCSALGRSAGLNAAQVFLVIGRACPTQRGICVLLITIRRRRCASLSAAFDLGAYNREWSQPPGDVLASGAGHSTRSGRRSHCQVTWGMVV